MSATVLDQLLLSQKNLLRAETQFLETQAIEQKLLQLRKDGRLLYEAWSGTSSR